MSDPTAAAVLTERNGAVAWITLNRPQAMNSINDEVRTQLPAALRALDMLLSAERIDAAEALRVGLITRLTTRAQLLAQTQTLAEHIAAHAPLAVVFAKEAMRKGTAADFATGMKYEADLLALLLDTEDRKEAGCAFREKRKPEFKGR